MPIKEETISQINTLIPILMRLIGRVTISKHPTNLISLCQSTDVSYSGNEMYARKEVQRTLKTQPFDPELHLLALYDKNGNYITHFPSHVFQKTAVLHLI